MLKRLRVYADTSVFGGCFDEEFKEDSRRFFAEVAAGWFTLVLSPTVLREFAGLSPEEQHTRTQEIITADPILARFWPRSPSKGPAEQAPPPRVRRN